VSTDYIAGYQQKIEYEGTPVQVDAPEGHSVKLTHLITMDVSRQQTLYLVDGRIGDKLLPLVGKIDFSFFGHNSNFAVGTITPDEPLRLYFSPPPGHQPKTSAAPTANFVIKGTIERWTPRVATATEQKSLGIFDIHDFYAWFQTQPVTDSSKKAWDILRPMLTLFQSGGEPPSPEPPQEKTADLVTPSPIVRQAMSGLFHKLSDRK